MDTSIGQDVREAGNQAVEKSQKWGVELVFRTTSIGGQDLAKARGRSPGRRQRIPRSG